MKRKYCKHGMSGTKLHDLWKEINRRVKGKYPGNATYIKNKIKVCEDWKTSSNFINWAINSGYREGLQIDRIDNKGNYCPENCRWVTPKENAKNREGTIYVSYNGKNETLEYWAEKMKINKRTLYTRLIRGWDIEDAITKKPQKRKKR